MPHTSTPTSLSAHARLRGMLGWVLWGLITLSCVGCANPQDALIAGPAVSQPTSAAKAKEGEPNDQGVTTLEETVDVAQVQSHLHHASAQLVDNYSGFLDQKPLGFGVDLATTTPSDIADAFETIGRAEARVEELSILRVGVGLIPFFIVFGFILLLTLLDRQSTTLSQRLQAKQNTRIAASLTLLARSATLITGQLAGPSLLLVASYFPVRALYGQTPWTLMLSNTLWLLAIYRLLQGVVETASALPWFDVDDAHTGAVRKALLLALRVIIISAQLTAAAWAFDLRPSQVAFVEFCFDLLLAVLPLSLIHLRSSVMALFPEQRDATTLYALLLRQLAQRYYWLLGSTSLLLMMRAFGYEHASEFILSRTYTIIGLLLASFIGMARVRRWFNKQIYNLSSNDQQAELLSSIKGLLTGALSFLVAVAIAEMLAIYSPLLTLLKTPVLKLSVANFSLYNILSALIIVGLATLTSKVVRAVLNARVYPRLGVDIGAAYAVNTIIGYAIVIIGFFLVLLALGANLSALTVVVASLSVGIGFGLQNITENLISGLIILFGRTVRKGDYVTVGDVYGRVEAVGARSIVIRTMDNYDLLIPSKELVGGSVINWTYRDSIARLHIPVGVAYSASPRHVEAVLIEAATKHDKVLTTPQPEVWLASFGDSSVNYELLVYYDCRQIMSQRLVGELNYHIWDALEQASIEIPFPQRDLHIRSSDLPLDLSALAPGKNLKDQ